VTLGEGIFNAPKYANSRRIAKIFDRRGRHPPKPNDLFLGIRAHLDAFAEEHPQGNFDSDVFRTLTALYVADKLKLICASCSQEFANLQLMNDHRKESHDNH
jgi:hypothetical protein